MRSHGHRCRRQPPRLRHVSVCRFSHEKHGYISPLLCIYTQRSFEAKVRSPRVLGVSPKKAQVNVSSICRYTDTGEGMMAFPISPQAGRPPRTLLYIISISRHRHTHTLTRRGLKCVGTKRCLKIFVCEYQRSLGILCRLSLFRDNDMPNSFAVASVTMRKAYQLSGGIVLSDEKMIWKQWKTFYRLTL